MGTYDEIRINGALYQTKALGKGMSLYSQGDEVSLVRSPFSELDILVRDLGEWDFTPEGNPRTYQFQVMSGSTFRYHYILVEKGIITGLLMKPRSGLPTYDYHGHLIKQ